MCHWSSLPPFDPNAPRGTVYLLCFDHPFGHARHYVGWTSDLPARLDRHRSGHGSPLIRAAQAAGIGFTVTRTWENVTRWTERRLKNRGSAVRLCPRCRAARSAEKVTAA